MSVTLEFLEKLIGGTLVGDAQLHIHEAATIARATAGQITFVTNPQHWQEFLKSDASAAIVSGVDDAICLAGAGSGKPSTAEGAGSGDPRTAIGGAGSGDPRTARTAGDPGMARTVGDPGTAREGSSQVEKSWIKVVDAEVAFTRVVAHFRPPVHRRRIGVSSQAVLSPSAVIETDVDIYPGAYVGEGVVIGKGSTIFPGVCILENCRIGRDVTIYPNAVLYENTVVGDGSIIHAGVVLGAFGFGYRTRNGRHELSCQLGSVRIGSQVEIGANTTIDRGTFEATIVGDGTKLDDQVMIGHNCSIGRHNLLCSQVGIAGSSSTGDYVVMAGQVGIGDHLQIGERTTICAKAGIMNHVPAGETYLGIPATPIREQMQIMACINKLPEIRSQVRGLTKSMEQAGLAAKASAKPTNESKAA